MKRQISKWENSFDSRKTLTLQADQSLVWVSARIPTNVPPKQGRWSKHGFFPHRGCLKCQQESRAGAAVPPRLAVPSRRGGCLTKALPFTHQPWLVYVFRPSRLQPDLCRSWNRRWARERLFSHPTGQAMLFCPGLQLQTAVSRWETTLDRFPPTKGAAGCVWNAPASAEARSCQEKVGGWCPRTSASFFFPPLSRGHGCLAAATGSLTPALVVLYGASFTFHFQNPMFRELLCYKVLLFIGEIRRKSVSTVPLEIVVKMKNSGFLGINMTQGRLHRVRKLLPKRKRQLKRVQIVFKIPVGPFNT